MATGGEAGRRLAAETENPSPLAAPAVRRQTPEVGAVCGSSARTDLCGGRSVTGAPTAISQCLVFEDRGRRAGCGSHPERTATRPAAGTGDQDDDAGTEDYSGEGGFAGAGQAAWECEPSLQDVGL